MSRLPVRFFAVTFAWSWAAWAPLVFAAPLGLSRDLAVALTVPLTVLGAFGPFIGALASVPAEGPGAIKRYLRRFIDLRLGARAGIAPIVLLGATSAIAWLLPLAFGEPFLPMLLPSIWVFPPYVLLMIFLGGGQEELGWRGYALERMEASLGVVLGNVVLGLIWALWHAPLWYVPGASQQYMSFAGFVLLTQGYSYFLAWVYHAAGRRPFAALWTHGWANAWIPLMPVLRMQAGASQPRFWIWVVLTFALGLVFLARRRSVSPCP